MATPSNLDLIETAKLLGVTEEAVKRWARKGALPQVSVNGNLVYPRTEVLAWAKKMGLRMHGAMTGNPAITEEIQDPLIGAFRRGGFIAKLAGDSVAEVYAGLVDQINLPGTLRAKELGELLMAREKLGSTAMGEGIALPHPRQALSEHVRHPHLVLARLEKPIDFQAIDGQPVSMLILLLSSSLQNHLDMLARVANLIRTDNGRSILEEAESQDDLCKGVETWLQDRPSS